MDSPLLYAVYVFFYGTMACYIAAAVVSAIYWRSGDPRILRPAQSLVWAANACLVIVFIARWKQWGLVPMTGLADSLNVFLFLSTSIMLAVQLREACQSLLAFYLPPVAIIALINALFGYQYLQEAPRTLNGILLAVHVGLVFLALALFLVASMTSVAYAFQAQNLKRNRTTGLFQKLPSLEQLDKTLYGMISVGYPVFVVTVVVGLVWAWFDRELLGDTWWLSPKIFLAMFMALVFAASFHSRQIGWLRGPKLAYLVFVGFTFLMATYLILELMKLGDYNFWGAAA